jgi:site-specific DNA recombinase
MSQTNRVTGTDAVSYLRVSDVSQVKTDYDPEGNSIPAQREANKLRARDVSAVIVAEFVDPGRTGTSMEKRPEFLAMLRYVKENPNIKYVIVYALSRFTRNRYDDAVLMMSLNKLGVTLLSATERNLDDTPAGKAMHGMIAVFNQYRSDVDGEDISYKMGQKVIAKGGALGSARVGYRNVRDFSEGREIRTIAVDHERDRAALVKESFELFATGEHTLDTAWPIMVDRGLTERATPSKPERPIARATFGKMLRHRFYIGEVWHKGQWYSGRHETFIDKELFDRVQRVLDIHSGAGVRQRKLKHYLKGVFWCQRCGSRMIYAEVKGRYEYFYCAGTKTKLHCNQPYVPAETLERELINHHHRVRLTDDFRAKVNSKVDETVTDEQAATVQLEARLTKRLTELDAQEDRYLDLIGDPDWPQDKIKTKLAKVRQERSTLAGQLGTLAGTLDIARQVFADALELLAKPYELYRQLPDAERRLMTLTVFDKLKVDTKKIVDHELRPPFAELVEVQKRRDTPSKARKSYQRLVGRLDATWQTTLDQVGQEMTKGTLVTEDALNFDTVSTDDLLELALFEGLSSHKALMVELRGLEPLTPCMPCRCATSCATAPSGSMDPVKRRTVYVSRARPRRPPGSACVVPGLLLRRATRVVFLEAPATSHVGQHRPATVRQRSEPPPGVRGHPQTGSDGGAGGAAVGDRNDQRAGTGLLEPLIDALHAARTHFGVRFSAASTGVLAGLPARVLLRKLRLRLGSGEALPRAEEDLAQSRVDVRSEVALGTHGRGRVHRPRQIRTDQQIWLHRRDRNRRGLGLRSPDHVERGVELTLEATGRVPVGTAVPEQDDSAYLAHEAGGSASTGSGSIGQSFQSRSRE